MLRRLAISLFLTVIAIGVSGSRSQVSAMSSCQWGSCIAGECPADATSICLQTAPPTCLVSWTQCLSEDRVDCDSEGGASYVQCAGGVY
jgi:hypothetical protein